MFQKIKLKLKVNFNTNTIKKHIPKMTTTTYMEKQNGNLNAIWMYHTAGRRTASITRETYKTNVDITSQSLLNKKRNTPTLQKIDTHGLVQIRSH